MFSLANIKHRLLQSHGVERPKEAPSRVASTKSYQFGNFTLEIPSDHKIEEIHKVDLLYDRNIGMIIEEIARKYPYDTMTDIGANVGDTAAFIRSHCQNPIICIEGGKSFLQYLRKNIRVLGDNITLIDKFIMPDSDRSSAFSYSAGAGTGTLSLKQSDSEGVDSISVQELIDLKVARNSSFCLVKSDTDGFDGPILSNMISHLETNFYFECDPNAHVTDTPFDWDYFFRMLDDKNYAIAVFDNFGLPIVFCEKNFTTIMSELLHYLELQRTLRRISIYYYDIWAFRPEDRDIFQRAQRHYKTRA